MISDKEFLFGPVFVRLVDGFGENNVSIRKYGGSSRCSFVINDKIGIYIKTSSVRNSPWNFTFIKEHQDALQELRNNFENVFLLLVCNDDGIAALSFDELKHILDYDHLDTEWIRVQRKKGEKYTVYGHDGELNHKIGDNEFPRKITDL